MVTSYDFKQDPPCGKGMKVGMLQSGENLLLSPSYFEADNDGSVWVDTSRDLHTNYFVGFSETRPSYFYKCHVVLDRLENGEFVATDNPQPWPDILIANDINKKGKRKLLKHTLKVYMPKIYYTKKRNTIFIPILKI